MRSDLEAITDFKPFRLPKDAIDIDKRPGGYPMLHPGDLVWWRDVTLIDEYKFGRVYGLLRKREKPKIRTGEICVILLTNDGSVWERFITKDMIYKVCRATSQVTLSLQWLFSTHFIDTPEPIARDCSAKQGWELLKSIPRGQGPNLHLQTAAIATVKNGKISSQHMRAKWIRQQVKLDGLS